MDISPIDHSHCTQHAASCYNFIQLPFRRGPWVSPLTSTSISRRSWCWCPLIKTDTWKGGFPKRKGARKACQGTPAGRFDWLGLFGLTWDCLFFFPFHLICVGELEEESAYRSCCLCMKSLRNRLNPFACKAKTWCPFDVILYSPTHPFHQSLV